MNKQTLDRLITEKKQILNERLEEYKKSLNSSISSLSRAQDYDNVASISLRYSTIIAKLEAEIAQLQDLYMYIEEWF